MLDVAQLKSALSERGAKAECLSCGSDDWADPRFVNLANTSAYLLICNQCGFVRLHASKVIAS